MLPLHRRSIADVVLRSLERGEFILMRKILGIVSPLKVILLYSLLFFFSISQMYAADTINVKLQWDASTGPDLDHYVVYWGRDFDPPYAYNSGNIDKSQITYTVTGLSDDKKYYFAAKAFDTEGRESKYSNIVSTNDPYELVVEEVPPPGVSAGGGGCFIATAAYGSNMDKHVIILSKFRDKHLLTNAIGRSIVDAYYKLSPPVASYLHKHSFEKVIVRCALIPIAGIAYISLYIHPLVLLFAFILLILTGVYFFKQSAIRRQPSVM